jgi:hypothetical protein
MNLRHTLGRRAEAIALAPAKRAASACQKDTL